MGSLQNGAADVESLAVLPRFRLDFYACPAARADELCELADAVLCADGLVGTWRGCRSWPEKEIIRRLKRYATRQVYPRLRQRAG